MSRLPIRFLTASSVAGLSLLLAPTAPAQISPGTAEASDAPEPRFGMFRDPAGYEGSERRDPVDYNGELLAMEDGALTLSLYKGVNANEALEVQTEGEYPAEVAPDAPTIADVDPGAPGAAPEGTVPPGAAAEEPTRVRIGNRTRVFLNGRRARMSDLRPGDRIRVRGVDPDGGSVEQIVALRTDDIAVGDGLELTPDIDASTGPATAPGASTDPSTARAAETGVTTPGGGGFQEGLSVTPRGETKENLEDPNRGVDAGEPAAPSQPMADEMKGAPGFGFAVADSPGEGVLIAEVQSGGPAAQAGVQKGDFLTRIDGQSVNEPEDVKKVAQAAPEGEDAQPVTATLWRDGEEVEVEMTPSANAADYFEGSVNRALNMPNNVGVNPALGAQVRDSEETGVEILAGAAVGALAAQAGESESNRVPYGYGPGYGGGYYPAPATPAFTPASWLGGANIYDYAGYGYFPVATGYDINAMRLRNRAIAAQLQDRAVANAIGADAEDAYPGRSPYGNPGYGNDSNPRQSRADASDRLLPNDRIIGVNNRPIHDRQELNRAIDQFNGDMLRLNVVRNGSRMTVELPKREAQQAAE